MRAVQKQSNKPCLLMNERDVGNVVSFVKKETNCLIPKRLQINVITHQSLLGF